MGLSRNKVAVPEGAAGTPPFWRGRLSPRPLSQGVGGLNKRLVCISTHASLLPMFIYIEKDEAEFGDVSRQLEASPIAQLVRAPH